MARNSIDRFILARLNQEKLKPRRGRSGRAHPRVSLDLTACLRRWRSGTVSRRPEAGAYERLVDRLLARESFGEHWARLWLDQARYADSTLRGRPARTIWAYRDYVIRALNANNPSTASP